MEEDENAFLVVAEAYCRYKAPAYYDDELIIRTHITELRKRSLRFGYEIVRAANGQVVAEGETGHVVTDSNGRVRSFPEGYAQRLLAPPVVVKSHPGAIVPTETAPE
jgi:acyl-CoA thioester hydrolase